MGKIVKFCADCEEGFAEKFGFCPNCGGHLAAYEMNPLTGMTQAPAAPPVEPEMPTPVSGAQAFEATSETPSFSATETAPPFNAASRAPEKTAIPAEKVSAPKTVETVPAAPARAAAAGSFQKNQATSVSNFSDGQYQITFVEEKDGGTRNALLVGAFALVMMLAVGGTIYSLFAKSVFIGALEDEQLLSFVGAPDEPEEIEVEPPKPKNDDEGGGGGGGGKKEATPVSKGVLASQEKEPLFPPTAHQIRTSDPIPITRATQGTVKAPPTDQPYGNPNSKFNVASDGPGSGGGMGAGQGTGQGNGRGTGAGNGIGSGMGNGIGNGTGNGRGNGREGDDNPPPAIKKPEPVGPTEGVKITAKPRANYTDPARQNQVTGVVRLRVTFLANGSIGSVTPVSNLPYGLTEQAVSAARGLRFEPAKKNGQPITVTKVVEYNFTLY